jgi:hypothetical protein
MQNFPEMDLIAWDQVTDDYDHTELANNFAKINLHDHTSGKGVQIPTEGIEDSAITSAKLHYEALGVGAFRARRSQGVTIPGDPTGPTVEAYAIPGYAGLPEAFPIPLNVEEYDVSGWFTPGSISSTTPGWVAPQGRYVPQVKGLYLFTATIWTHTTGGLLDDGFYHAAILKNGETNFVGTSTRQVVNDNDAASFGGSALLFANGTTDYFELGAGQSVVTPPAQGPPTSVNGPEYATSLSGFLVREIP